MDSTLRNVLIVCICIITFSVSYFFVFYLPKEKEKDRAEVLKKEQAARDEKHDKEMSYYKCKVDASSVYDANWQASCKARNLKPDCSLPFQMAKRWDEKLKDDQEECRKIYLGNP